ncbi:MAG TPA: hypothetical protein PKK60_02890, partial [archaeon]|nr:hypothetical protein [archaeon]
MGVGDSLREIYYSWEEKWYDALDKIDAHLPIYKVIDPIDQVFPSFALFLILFFILLLIISLGLFGIVGTQQSTLTLSVVDESGAPISFAEVKIEGINKTYYTNDFGLVEPVIVTLGRTLNVEVKKDTARVETPLIISNSKQNSEITLKGYGIDLMESKTILILDEQGMRVTDKVTLNFECSTGKEPMERTKDTFNGTANVEVKSDCGTLLVTAISEKYERKNVSLIGPSTIINLSLLIPTETGRATITLKNADGNLISESITVQAYRAANLYSPAETATSVNGSATFELPIGEYKFRTIAGSGYKVSEMTTIYNITKTTPTTVSITLQKSFFGKIKVTTKVGNTLLNSVKVTLMKGTIEVESKVTGTDGVVEFEAPEIGPFNIYATKDGYCESITTASAPSDVNITMRTNTGTCGGKLNAKIIDADGKPVVFARVIIFGQKDDEEYKTTYIEKLTDYNGTVSWNPVKYTEAGEKYKIFAFKGAYSGWSELKEFKTTSETEAYVVKLEIPLGKINIIVKDNYGNPLTNEDGNPVYVQLFGDYDNSKITGQRIIEGTDGRISFDVKAGRKAYAVIKKEGYETYTTIPKLIIGNGVTTFNVVLSKPPIEEIRIKPLGLYKNESKVLTVQAGQEYLALFELIAPKRYQELGFFIRVGKDTVTKSELDNLYIKEMIAPGINTIVTGGSYNKPKGYNTDEQYLNLEQSKWGQVKWNEYDYAVGKIIVGAIIKIKENAPQANDVIAYRAWGINEEGEYERDIKDEVLGTSQNASTKQELYAAANEQIISIGTEALCEESEQNTFCISSTYTDIDGFTNNFESSFDAKNNSLYNLNIKVMSRAQVTFDKAAIKLENAQENLYLGDYSIIKPREGIVNGTINGYESEWISTPDYSPGTSITINSLQLTPRKIGTGELKLRLRNDSKLVLEKIFSIFIASDKKMKVQYMYDSKFQDDLPKLVSGKNQPITVKVFNNANNIEVENAIVKLYDRFGTKLTEELTNKLGIATLNVPAALPAEKLTIKIEKPEYETYVKEFNISEDIVEITPTELSFTLNPQTATSDSKTVKIENKTGFDLTIKEIKLTGKLKGLVSESQVESWMNTYKGTKIPSNDFIETEFKVFIGRVITQSDDLEGTFQIIVGNEYNEWVKEINAKIRVGLGKDVDNPSCLEITKTSWEETTQGKEVQVAFDIINNCMVDSVLVELKNLGARNETTGNNLGTMSVQSTTAYVELSKSYNRVFRTKIEAGEKVPITVKFTPFGGVNGTTTGTIVFEAKNNTDSKDQVVSTSMEYTINAINLQDCLVIGADLITIEEEGTASFSITNNCVKKADFSIDSELQLSDKIFSIESKGTKDVTVIRNEGDIGGAYNILVYARQGNDKQELIGNVKAILPTSGCIELTRYEYDVYDSEYNEYDGTDVGYLKNYCTEKNIGVEVSGEEEYDKSRVWQQALIGAVIGFFKSDCDSWIGKLTGFKCHDTNKWVDESEKNASKALQQATDKLKAATKMTATEIDANIKATQNKINAEIEKGKNILEAQEKSGKTAIETRYAAMMRTCANCGTKKTECESKANTFRDSAIAELNEMVKAKKTQREQVVSELDNATKDTTSKIQQALGTTTKNITDSKTRLQEQIQNSTITTKDLEPKMKEQELEAEKQFAQGLLESDNKRLEAYNKFKEWAKEENYKLSKTEVEKIRTKNTTTTTEIENLCKGEVKEQVTPTGTLAAQPNIPQAVKNKYPNAKSSYDDTGKYLFILNESGGYLGHVYQLSDESWEEVNAEHEVVKYNKDGTKMTPEQSTPQTTAAPEVPKGNPKEDVRPEKSILPTTQTNTNEAATSTGTIEVPIKNVSGSEATTKVKIKEQDLTILTQGETRLISFNRMDNKKVIQQNISEEIYIWEPQEDGTYKRTLKLNDEKYVTITSGMFLLSSTTSTSNDMLGGISNLLTNNVPGIAGGMFGNSALVSGLIAALTEMASAKNTPIEYTDTFGVDKVTIDDVTLESAEGITVEKGEVTYDFDSSNDYASSVGESASVSSSNTSTTGTTNDSTSTGTSNNNYNYSSGVNFNTQSMTASSSTVKIQELTFSNPNKKVNDSPYKPFSGTLTVTASENVYQTDYNYKGIKSAAKERGDYEETKGIFDDWWLIGDLFKPESTTIAEMSEEDLVVDEIRDYTKKFHLLFNAYEYVDCGPDTYQCPETVLGNCVIDNGKTGSTGPDAAPRIKLSWSWTGSEDGLIDIDTCDEDNADYVYCDTTQFTISTLKKIQKLKEFIKSNSLTKCPTAIDIAAVKENDLSKNTLDVALTRVQFRQTTDGATLEAIVKSNNQLPMNTKVTFALSRNDGTIVSVPQCEIEKELISEQIYSCDVKTSEIGTGQFNILVSAEPTLCEGCKNLDTTNDTIATMLILDTGSVQNCEGYTTESNYFARVLSANELLTTTDGANALGYTNFTVNLVRDAFSEDFKTDFDNYSKKLVSALPFYTTEGLSELFRSERFVIEWPNKPAPWKAGKYNAKIIIEFNDNWVWNNDNNNIKKVTVKLEPWGDPEPFHTIYNIGFNGLVGLDSESENGRVGYGTNYQVMSEEAFYITDTIKAEYDTSGTPVTKAIVSVDDSFYNLNNPVRKGNVLTVSRVGDDVKLILSPSIAVPMVLNVTRTQARDAYAYYLVEVDGKAQNEMGATFMQWTGIGEGCFDFSGKGMGNWTNAGDEKSETTGQGYGLRWNNATGSGTVSLYGTMYTPEKSASVIKITAQSESATLETPFGNGST